MPKRNGEPTKQELRIEADIADSLRGYRHYHRNVALHWPADDLHKRLCYYYDKLASTPIVERGTLQWRTTWAAYQGLYDAGLERGLYSEEGRDG
jgi:hypothetical protein